MAFTDAADQGDDPGAGGGSPPAAPGPGGGAPDGAPGGSPTAGGGPILAALAGQQRGPQVSAPGMGDQSNAMQMVMQALSMMQQALPSLQVGSPLHRDAIRAIQSLSKHMPQGAPTAGVQKTHLQDMLRSVVRNALVSRLMQSQGQQPGGAGQGPGAPPMPSTPLPGS